MEILLYVYVILVRPLHTLQYIDIILQISPLSDFMKLRSTVLEFFDA
jgi:hypothetical protein